MRTSLAGGTGKFRWAAHCHLALGWDIAHIAD